MGRDWSHRVPPSITPAKSFLYLGADPSWTPSREGRVARHQPLPSADSCPVCGGRPQSERDDDPLSPSELVAKACGRCMRASVAESRLAGSVHKPDESRPGAMASKVKGKPDPALNAYLDPEEHEARVNVRDRQADAAERTAAAVAGGKKAKGKGKRGEV